MTHDDNYCDEKGISTSKLNEAQRTLYYIAENMKMDKSISKEGYKHFQMAIKVLEQEPVLDKIRAEIDSLEKWSNGSDYFVKIKAVNCILDKYKAESEDKK